MLDLSHLFISSAWAQGASVNPTIPANASTSDVVMNFLPLILIFAVFYFLIIRPQQKKMEQHQGMLKALAKGDKVVTGGGVVATVQKLDGDDHLIVEIADGVRVKVVRSTISSIWKEEAAKKADVAANEAKN